MALLASLLLLRCSFVALMGHEAWIGWWQRYDNGKSRQASRGESEKKNFEILTRKSNDGSSENAQHTTRNKERVTKSKMSSMKSDTVTRSRQHNTFHGWTASSTSRIGRCTKLLRSGFSGSLGINACVVSTKFSNCIFFLKVGWGFTRISTLNNKWREHCHECCSSDDGKFRLT